MYENREFLTNFIIIRMLKVRVFFLIVSYQNQLVILSLFLINFVVLKRVLAENLMERCRFVRRIFLYLYQRTDYWHQSNYDLHRSRCSLNALDFYPELQIYYIVVKHQDLQLKSSIYLSFDNAFRCHSTSLLRLFPKCFFSQPFL